MKSVRDRRKVNAIGPAVRSPVHSEFALDENDQMNEGTALATSLISILEYDNNSHDSGMASHNAGGRQ